MSENIKDKVFDKVISMFRASDAEFLDFRAVDTIIGPNDRATIGFDTYFPVKWLVEDYNFTEDEAKWFVDKVQQQRR